MCSPTDASPPPSRTTAHGSGSMWIATPSSRRTCTDYSLPVSRRTAKDSGHYQRIARTTDDMRTSSISQVVRDVTLCVRTTQYSFDIAFAWLVRPNLQLDVGADFGLTSATLTIQ